MLNPCDVYNGMLVRHTESGETFLISGAPFVFDGKPAVNLRDHKGRARMALLSGLEAADEIDGRTN